MKPELQEKLSRLLTQQGRDSRSLVVETVKRLVNYDEWFAQQAKEVPAAADRGEFVEHADVLKLINSRYPG
ncbi:MAG: hypothetical protein ABSG69_11485 [Candidatus Acidiferrum sp.]